MKAALLGSWLAWGVGHTASLLPVYVRANGHLNMSAHKNPLVFCIVSTDLLYPDFVLTSCPCGFDLTTARGVVFL